MNVLHQVYCGKVKDMGCEMQPKGDNHIGLVGEVWKRQLSHFYRSNKRNEMKRNKTTTTKTYWDSTFYKRCSYNAVESYPITYFIIHKYITFDMSINYCWSDGEFTFAVASLYTNKVIQSSTWSSSYRGHNIIWK